MQIPPAWAGPPPKPNRWRSWVIGCGCLPGVLVVLAILAGAANGDLSTLLIATLAAVIPAVLYSRIILSLDRYEEEPTRAILFAFGWGAVAAVLLAIVGELIFASSLIPVAGAETADIATLVIGAPVIEEAFKGVALLLLLWFYREEIDGVLDGLVYGALIGIGFAMTENILYFIASYQDDGASGLGTTFVIRVLINGFGHAMYTGAFGAAVGWSRTQYSKGWARVWAIIVGYLVAVLLHMAWNGGLVIVWSLLGEDASVWEVLLVLVPLFVVPPLATLGWIARRSGTTTLSVLASQLESEIGIGVLTPAEYRAVVDPLLRKEAMAAARAAGGWSRWRVQRRLLMAAADLAYRKHHIEQVGAISARDWWAIELDRQEIWRSRTELSGGEPAGRSSHQRGGRENV